MLMLSTEQHAVCSTASRIAEYRVAAIGMYGRAVLYLAMQRAALPWKRSPFSALTRSFRERLRKDGLEHSVTLV